MPVLDTIASFADDMTTLRRDLHEHPEIGFEEERTAGIVAEKLESWGIEVHTGLAATGVVGILKGKGEGIRAVGLRADMDALPMTEETGLPFASKNPGRFHGCGHDGHTTMLLGAARHLAETRNFSGTAVFIFQPAEEGLGGARRMISEGLFSQFPCDEVYGMHNNPMAEPMKVGVKPGTAMAGASFFDLTINGAGGHAAMPQDSRDPIVIAGALIQQLQSVVSRNVPPLRSAVLSVTQAHAGSTYNVVPGRAVLSGTVRYFDDKVHDLVERRIRALCSGIAQAYEVEIEVDLRPVFDVLVNDPELSFAYLEAAADIVGKDNVAVAAEPVTGSEDFADMLKAVPGAYCTLGHAGKVPLHNPGFVLDDGILPVGASILARILERRLQL